MFYCMYTIIVCEIDGLPVCLKLQNRHTSYILRHIKVKQESLVKIVCKVMINKYIVANRIDELLDGRWWGIYLGVSKEF